MAIGFAVYTEASELTASILRTTQLTGSITKTVTGLSSFRYLPYSNQRKCGIYGPSSPTSPLASCDFDDESMEFYGSVSFKLILPAKTKVDLHFTARKKFLRRSLQQPDASR